MNGLPPGLTFKPGDVYTDTKTGTSYVRTAAGQWRVVASNRKEIVTTGGNPIRIQSETPSDGEKGDIWYKLENDSVVPCIWDGDEWLQVSPSNTEPSDLGRF